MDKEQSNQLSLDEFGEYIKGFSTQQLLAWKRELDDLYYNTGESYLDDYHYDILKEYIGDNAIGAPIRSSNNRVVLPYWLGSADKITPKDAIKFLTAWGFNYDFTSRFTLSDKLDGVSCLLVMEEKTMKLYSRGDGKIGGDISHLVRFIKLPTNLPKDMAVRGELIISKANFARIKGDVYTNPRNTVAGVIGSVNAKPELRLIDFVAYEVINPSGLTIGQQFELLESLGFKTAHHKFSFSVDVPILENYLTKRKKESPYEIDGIIVHLNSVYTRNTEGNPKYMAAFKMLIKENVKRTVVREVEWDISQYGYLKPVVIVEPVIIDNSLITRVSAHNAKYIQDNRIGKGTILNITKANDVIPYIVDVVHATTPDFPDCEYVWDANRVNIKTTKETKDEKIKRVVTFFTTIGVKGVKGETIAVIYNAGYDTVFKIIGASEAEIARLFPGNVRGRKIYTSIHDKILEYSVKTPDNIATLLDASTVFGHGIGKKILLEVLEAYPDVFKLYKALSEREFIDRIMHLRSFSEVRATMIYDGMGKAAEFLATFYAMIPAGEVNVAVAPVETAPVPYTNPLFQKVSLAGKKIALSGSRALQTLIQQQQGDVTDSVSSKTFVLVVADKNARTTKYNKAVEMKIPILNEREFTTYVEKKNIIEAQLNEMSVQTLQNTIKKYNATYNSDVKANLINFILDLRNPIMIELLNCLI